MIASFLVRIEEGFYGKTRMFSPDRLVNRALTAKRGRRLCVARVCTACMPLSKYTQPTTAFGCLFPVPVKHQGCQYRSRKYPSQDDAQVVATVDCKQT